MKRLILDEAALHDACVAVTESIMDCFQNCLREEEKALAAEEIYARVRAGIEAYVVFVSRRQILDVAGRN